MVLIASYALCPYSKITSSHFCAIAKLNDGFPLNIFFPCLRNVDSTSTKVANPSLIPEANKRTGACATILNPPLLYQDSWGKIHNH